MTNAANDPSPAETTPDEMARTLRKIRTRQTQSLILSIVAFAALMTWALLSSGPLAREASIPEPPETTAQPIQNALQLKLATGNTANLQVRTLNRDRERLRRTVDADVTHQGGRLIEAKRYDSTYLIPVDYAPILAQLGQPETNYRIWAMTAQERIQEPALAPRPTDTQITLSIKHQWAEGPVQVAILAAMLVLETIGVVGVFIFDPVYHDRRHRKQINHRTHFQ